MATRFRLIGLLVCVGMSAPAPTVHLLRTDWYRQNGRYDQPILVALRFIGAHTVTARDTRGHQSDAVILVK